LNKIKKYFILIIAMLLTMIFELGIYQSDVLGFGSINIHKPFGYRFYSAPIEYNSLTFWEKQKHFFGYYTTFDTNSTIAFLVFKNFFLNNTISLQMHSIDDKSRMFKYKYKENIEKFINEKKCLYTVDYDVKNNVYIIDGLIKEYSMTFYIMGTSKDDTMAMKADICKELILD